MKTARLSRRRTFVMRNIYWRTSGGHPRLIRLGDLTSSRRYIVPDALRSVDMSRHVEPDPIERDVTGIRAILKKGFGRKRAEDAEKKKRRNEDEEDGQGRQKLEDIIPAGPNRPQTYLKKTMASSSCDRRKSPFALGLRPGRTCSYSRGRSERKFCQSLSPLSTIFGKNVHSAEDGRRGCSGAVVRENRKKRIYIIYVHFIYLFPT